MTIALVLLVLAAGIAVLAMLFALERKKCPVCRRRAVAMRFTDGYTDGKTNIVSFRCKKCRAEFRTLDGGPLIPREAFDAGVREPVPEAKVVRK